MSREQQIEEMAKDLYENRPYRELWEEDAQDIAKVLYKAGYRKQIEGRWKGAGMGDYLCSECWSVYSGGDEYNYCPDCGAKMK